MNPRLLATIRPRTLATRAEDRVPDHYAQENARLRAFRAEERRRAARFVASQAVDAVDAAQLLAALDLDPEEGKHCTVCGLEALTSEHECPPGFGVPA